MAGFKITPVTLKSSLDSCCITSIMTNLKLADFGPPDANGLVWKRCKSAGGKDFEFGLKESDLKQAIEAHATKSPSSPPIASDLQIPVTAAVQKAAADPEDQGWIPVNWKVGEAVWIDTDQATKDEGVSQYQLWKSTAYPSSEFYAYMLWFTNTKGWCFHFLDDTHDCYNCSTIRNGEHYIKYNSDEPTIKFVKEGSYDHLPDTSRYGR
ncbi:hypothetical protein L218DRAFT_1000569 [Marasmius fiardii PR-910]|nr:hypothetical protein L218DRAFT_1000569 [Marasmius fiardii PR-910]